MEFLKRRNRRNNLIKELSNFTSVTYESLMESDINDLFCQKVFDMLSTLTNKVSIKEENYMGNIKTSIQLIEKTLRNSNLHNNSGRVLFRSEEHTSELQSRGHLVCRLLLGKKNS